MLAPEWSPLGRGLLWLPTAAPLTAPCLGGRAGPPLAECRHQHLHLPCMPAAAADELGVFCCACQFDTVGPTVPPTLPVNMTLYSKFCFFPQ